MELNLVKVGKEANSKKYDAIVFFEHSSTNKFKQSSELQEINTKTDGLIEDYIEEENFEAKLASILNIDLRAFTHINEDESFNFKKVIIVGLGEKKKFDTKAYRKVLAKAFRAAKNQKISSLAIRIPEFPPENAVKTAAESLVLLNYEFDKYKSKDKEKSEAKDAKKIENVTFICDSLSKKLQTELKEGQIIATGVNKTRDLVWEPACTVNPTYLAAEAKKIKTKGLTVKILEKADCQKKGMGAYLAVAQGSDQPPKFIEFSYKPSGKIKKHIALVGKGVTFDSGGLSLKPPKAMEMMKYDMAGSAAILGIMQAISKLKPSNVQITAVVAATENMPSGKAYRPGDVITAMNGKTIEVNNTDAEGRLTLADAVAHVSTKNPDLIIDFATLTGAVTVALGDVAAGLMGNNQDLIDKIKESSERQGEKMWQLPLYDEYKASLKSSIADLINAGSKGKAGAQNGALFVGEFVGKKAGKAKNSEELIPWAHIDIAGPCWVDAPTDLSPKGASGIPVRTILDFIANV